MSRSDDTRMDHTIALFRASSADLARFRGDDFNMELGIFRERRFVV